VRNETFTEGERFYFDVAESSVRRVDDRSGRLQQRVETLVGIVDERSVPH